MTTTSSTETLIKRQANLTALLAQNGFDAIALNAGPSQAYFSGLHFHLMERPAVLLLAPKQAPVLALPGFESGKTAGLSYELRTVTYGEDPAQWQAVFNQAAGLLGAAKRIAVEGLHLRVMELRYLEAAFPGATFEAAEPLIAQLRMRKDAGEIAVMQRAVEIAETALEATLPKVKIGMTEKQIAGELIQQLFAHGSDPALPFQPIVAAGPNSANPHATISDRKLQSGDLLLFDWGASVDGYLSDLTRTFAVGEISEEFKRVYEVVKLANQAGRDAAKPGAPCSAVDAAARDAIEDSGYGEYFTHRTGHGLGLETHEDPYMRAGNEVKLEAGMTFTVEPGIYLDGRGGVRIEDNVVITDAGSRTLSKFPRELRVIG
ncbi:MAG TPA: Xaa-Pro peptidase family protein [Anaerolineales bacterium]|nr:Xaa-Pro peptidase family protein [Anaerolineales bacterium]